MWTDSHCHLELKDFGKDGIDERPEVIERARTAGVTRLVCIGSGGSFDEVENAAYLARSYDHIWASVAIHPHDAKHVDQSLFDKIAAVAAEPRVVAIGEIGLDCHYDHSPLDVQATVFRRFIALARSLKKPITMHIRDAHDQAIEMLRDERASEIGGVVHCFTGNAADARRYLDLGLYISFSGIVTFKSAESIREAAKLVPSDRILIETDCPYLAPMPLRGKRNEPAYLVHTGEFLAQLRGVEPSAFAAQTSQNCATIFGLPF